MAGLIITNSTPVFAASTSEDEIDFNLLADGITAKQNLDAEYAKLGINLDDILALPAREDFQQAGLAYLEEASKTIPVSYAEDT